ncbi:uncharacterized protein LOC129596303 [Paramacrobiotus metropolitanus]|uniref:uncharacterized protein LOC129596303 n=1 Tax=Paramacrobiotus metropolitanus TaxID=2943436 RepID=UPI0024461158|nr:uncharacterized protein LOC129596303 [Paramacrobiotus metropolitanus]XP_055349516.1 uncharacterized protein LOC129596303 [Paramacrobiotus metropolitanus]
MLAIGLPHEHVRPDRDDNISINLENVPPERRTEFDKIGTAALDMGDYDYESLLHPDSNFLALDKTLPTISAKNKNFKIWGATKLSDKDVIKLKHLLCGEKLPSTSKATTASSMNGDATSTSVTKRLFHLPRKLNRRTDGKSSFISPSVGDLVVTDNDGSDTIQPSAITAIPLSENTTPSLDTKPDVATLPFVSVNPEEPTDDERRSKTDMRTVTVTKTVTETMTQVTTMRVDDNKVTDKMFPITKTQDVVHSTVVSRRPKRPTTTEVPDTTTQNFDMPETSALPAGIPIPEMAILPTPTQNCPARQMMKLYINQTLARTSILVDGLHTHTIRDYSNYYYWNWFTPDAEDERDYLAYTVHYPLFNGAIATVRTMKFEASTRVFSTKYRIQQLPNGGSLMRKKNETRYVECADYVDEHVRR